MHRASRFLTLHGFRLCSRLRDSASGAGVPDDHVKLVKLQHRTRAAAQEVKGKTLAFLFVVKGKGPFQAFPPVQQRQCGQGNIRLILLPLEVEIGRASCRERV